MRRQILTTNVWVEQVSMSSPYSIEQKFNVFNKPFYHCCTTCNPLSNNTSEIYMFLTFILVDIFVALQYRKQHKPWRSYTRRGENGYVVFKQLSTN